MFGILSSEVILKGKKFGIKFFLGASKLEAIERGLNYLSDDISLMDIWMLFGNKKMNCKLF